MTGASPVTPQRRLRARAAIWLLVGSGLLVVGLANAHLVYVAIASQPDCVARPWRASDGAAQARVGAAEWACAPPRHASAKALRGEEP